MKQHVTNESQTFQLTPAHPSEPDEIDIFELFSGMAGQWRLMLKVVIVGVLLLVAYLIWTPREYGASIQIRPMTIADLTLINQQGVSTYSVNQLYARFLDTLIAPDNLAAFVTTYKIFKNSLVETDVASGPSIQEMNKFLRAARLHDVDFNGKTIKEKDKEPYRVKYSWEDLKNADQAHWVNNYANFISKKVLGGLQRSEKLLIQIKLERIKREIKGLRYTADGSRKFKIDRLTSADHQKIADYTGQINILKQASKRDRLFRLSQLQSAYKLARTLKLQRPFLLNSKGAPKNKEGLVLRMDAQPLPEYFSGTIALAQKIIEFKKEKLLDQYAKQVSELEKKIQAVKQDPELATLKARISDDPYILELPDLLNTLRALKEKLINFQSVTLFHFERKALLGKLIKPRLVLVLVFGAFLIGFIALIAGAVRVSFLNHEASKNSIN